MSLLLHAQEAQRQGLFRISVHVKTTKHADEAGDRRQQNALDRIGRRLGQLDDHHADDSGNHDDTKKQQHSDSYRAAALIADKVSIQLSEPDIVFPAFREDDIARRLKGGQFQQSIRRDAGRETFHPFR